MSQLQTHRQEIRKRLADENTFATELLLIAMDVYGAAAEDGSIDWANSEVLDWHPKVIIEGLEAAFDVQCPDTHVDKLGAALSLVTTNFFFQDVNRFIDICNALSGTSPDPRVLDLADADETLWGLYEGTRLVPTDPEDPDDRFSAEIEAYVQQALAAEGLDFSLIANGAPVSPREFGAGDPMLEEAMGKAMYEQSHQAIVDYEESIARYEERVKTLPLRRRSRPEPAS